MTVRAAWAVALLSWIVALLGATHADAQNGAPSGEASGQAEGAGANHSNLSERATDPTQSPATLKLKADVTTHSYELPDGSDPETGVGLELQTVLPFTVWGVDNIFRITVPYEVAGEGPSGLEDVQIFDLLVFKVSAGRLGVGAVANLSAREKDVPSHASAGPALGFVGPVSRVLNLGLFSQNLFADGVAISLLQPFAALQLGGGWSLSTGDMQLAYDWEETRFSEVPIQVELGKLIAIATQPVRLAVGPEYNFKDLPGAERLQLKFKVELLVPSE